MNLQPLNPFYIVNELQSENEELKSENEELKRQILELENKNVDKADNEQSTE